MPDKKNARKPAATACIPGTSGTFPAGLVIAGTLTLPSGLVEIQDSAFEGAGSFSEVVIPDGVKSIGARAFADCSSLFIVHIPDSVINIGSDAFSGNSDIVLCCKSGSNAAVYAQNNHISYLIE